MNAHHPAALVAVLALAACEVDRTPDVYLDRGSAVQQAREAGGAEVRDRVLAMGQALSRGNAADALTALSPADDAYVISPQAGLEITGEEQIAAVLGSLAAEPVPVNARDVGVTVGPGGNVAWFRASLASEGAAPARPPVLITGVYLLDEGIWRLVQAHLSVPAMTPPTQSPPAADADSVEGG